MPHGESWFNLLPFFHALEQAAARLSAPVNDEGVTWIAHGPIGIQHVLGFLLVLLILCVLGLSARKQLGDPQKAIIPDDKLSARTFVELLVSTIYSMMSDIMGKKAARFFLPWIGTCAFIILFSNLLGLIPGFGSPTDTLNTTVALSLVTFLVTHIYGLKENGVAYLKHFMGPVIWLAPLFVVIELISHAARPLSLSIRLMGNMFADHQVVGAFNHMVKWLVPVAPMVLGTLVCVVQTLVFCILSTVYVAMAIEHHDDHAEAH